MSTARDQLLKDNFESEKAALVSTIEKNVVKLFEKYDLKGLPEGIIKQQAKRLFEGREPSPSGSEMSGSGSSSSSDSGDDSEKMSDEEEATNDESGYTIVTNRKRKPLNSPTTSPNSSATPRKRKPVEERTTAAPSSSGYYQLLGRRSEFEVQPKEKPAAAPKAARPPPIVCFNLNVKTFNQELNKLPTKPSFFVKTSKGTKCILKPQTEADHKAIFEIIKLIGVQSYTFTPKGERTTTLILRGVQHTFDAEDVKHALKEALRGLEINAVTHFKTNRDKFSNSFIVNFGGSYKVEKIMETNRLLGHIVYWEKYRASGITQCKRCQNYGHVARNCAVDYRCVKCKNTHEPGNCARKTVTEGVPYCVNCKAEGHPANYRGCPKYQQVKQGRAAKNEERRQRDNFVKEATRNFIQPGKSFAQVINNNVNSVTNPNPAPARVAPKTAPSTKPKESEVDDFCTKEAKSLFGCDLFTLMGKINNFPS